MAALQTESESSFSSLRTACKSSISITHIVLAEIDFPGSKFSLSRSEASGSLTRDSCLSLCNELKISKGNCK